LEAGVPRRRFVVSGLERDRGARGLSGGGRVVRAVAGRRKGAGMMHLVAILMLLSQTQATNAELGYRFAVPSGFTSFPEGRGQKDMVACWSEATPVSAHGAMILCVQRLHGVLPREAMRQEDLPTGTQLASFKWKEFDLQGLRSLASQQGGEQAFVLVTQVPLRHEAGQVFLCGPVGREAGGEAL